MSSRPASARDPTRPRCIVSSAPLPCKDWDRSRRIQNAANLPRVRNTDDGPRARSTGRRIEHYGHREISRQYMPRLWAPARITSSAGVQDHGSSKRCRSLASGPRAASHGADHPSSLGAHCRSPTHWLNPVIGDEPGRTSIVTKAATAPRQRGLHRRSIEVAEARASVRMKKEQPSCWADVFRRDVENDVLPRPARVRLEEEMSALRSAGRAPRGHSAPRTRRSRRHRGARPLG
jgi:hypothetical protein